MKNTAGSRYPVAMFPLPVNVPESVVPAQERFERRADEWGRTKGEIQDAEAELVEAAAADIRRAADAYSDGQEPDESKLLEPAAKAKLEGLQTRLAALSISLDEAGNALADAIGPVRDEWIDSFTPAAEDAEKRYRQAIAAAVEAVSDLGRARAGRDWLAEFDVGLAHVGLVRRFHGGSAPFRINRPQGFANAPSANELLELAEQAIDPANEPGLTPGERRRRIKAREEAGVV